MVVYVSAATKAEGGKYASSNYVVDAGITSSGTSSGGSSGSATSNPSAIINETARLAALKGWTPEQQRQYEVAQINAYNKAVSSGYTGSFGTFTAQYNSQTQTGITSGLQTSRQAQQKEAAASQVQHRMAMQNSVYPSMKSVSEAGIREEAYFADQQYVSLQTGLPLRTIQENWNKGENYSKKIGSYSYTALTEKGIAQAQRTGRGFVGGLGYDLEYTGEVRSLPNAPVVPSKADLTDSETIFGGVSKASTGETIFVAPKQIMTPAPSEYGYSTYYKPTIGRARLDAMTPVNPYLLAGEGQSVSYFIPPKAPAAQTPLENIDVLSDIDQRYNQMRQEGKSVFFGNAPVNDTFGEFVYGAKVGVIEVPLVELTKFGLAFTQASKYGGELFGSKAFGSMPNYQGKRLTPEQEKLYLGKFEQGATMYASLPLTIYALGKLQAGLSGIASGWAASAARLPIIGAAGSSVAARLPFEITATSIAKAATSPTVVFGTVAGVSNYLQTGRAVESVGAGVGFGSLVFGTQRIGGAIIEMNKRMPAELAYNAKGTLGFAKLVERNFVQEKNLNAKQAAKFLREASPSEIREALASGNRYASYSSSQIPKKITTYEPVGKKFFYSETNAAGWVNRPFEYDVVVPFIRGKPIGVAENPARASIGYSIRDLQTEMIKLQGIKEVPPRYVNEPIGKNILGEDIFQFSPNPTFKNFMRGADVKAAMRGAAQSKPTLSEYAMAKIGATISTTSGKYSEAFGSIYRSDIAPRISSVSEAIRGTDAFKSYRNFRFVAENTAFRLTEPKAYQASITLLERSRAPAPATAQANIRSRTLNTPRLASISTRSAQRISARPSARFAPLRQSPRQATKTPLRINTRVLQRENLRVQQREAVRIQTRLDTRTAQKQEVRQEFRLDTRLMQREALRVAQRVATRQSTRTSQRLALRQKVPEVPKIGANFRLPKAFSNAIKLKQPRKKQRFAYQPSLTASLLGIKAKVPKRILKSEQALAGFEFRPIASNRGSFASGGARMLKALGKAPKNGIFGRLRRR